MMNTPSNHVTSNEFKESLQCRIEYVTIIVFELCAEDELSFIFSGFVNKVLINYYVKAQ